MAYMNVSQSIIEGSQGRNQDGNLKVGMEAETQRNSVYWLFSYGLLRLLSYITKDYLHWG